MSYGAAFYARTTVAARRSAGRIVPLLANALHPDSVLDVGCGGGAWVDAWRQAGAGRVLGLDMAPPERSGSALPPENFRQIRLDAPFDLGRRFALVQSLEVAEHLPESAAKDFVASLCRHGDLILFSAAPPGQGGVHHVNERPFGYWRALFAERGYRAVDWLRPRIAGDGAVAWWYRYNILLYVRESALKSLPAELRAAAIPAHETIRDVAPVLHRLRRAVLRSLPPAAVTRIARLMDKTAGKF